MPYLFFKTNYYEMTIKYISTTVH